MTKNAAPRFRSPARQRGVAVITALLLTTLAITIVASLFWQQQVQVRSIENQRLQLQKQWILRGALDWTRLILREDGRISTVDHLGEPWAVNLAETRLDQYVDNASAETEVPDAVLSGSIVDAQSRLNLRNLMDETKGAPDPAEVKAFGALLSNLQLNPSLAQSTADLMTLAFRKKEPATGTPAATPASQSQSQSQPLGINHVDDLLAVPGFTPEIVEKLREFVIVLPAKTQINVNTAPAEVLMAKIDTLTSSDAAAIIAYRQRSYFKGDADVGQVIQRSLVTKAVFKTNYFLVNGNVRMNRAALQMQTLIRRTDDRPPKTEIIWIREY
ncbi:MAG TPA: type II secretion system minor pseudopilin GspK [Noviherbaspirillum sp.]|jgi:general secretion pathway protein K|uniref:type II secretion system minor pseudopilin GspK n=1 Tax=Noviherbaspirillum sp. TaxID=1926288 RepID=UPI002DDCD66F|nr:type II secretion system minor pseudopilin GspK [Noviherbaspirillum sp.]HEV2611155.1 type II secretion system minor pseudopilin GspK [Noviherbaspirillum sp.]